MSIAIQVENLSKVYQIGQIGTGTISRDLERWWTTTIRGKEDPFLKIGETNDRSTKGESDIVWSLKDINFEIQQGDAVGIIGRNGAGKSTLLKILSEITTPTTGKVNIKGRVASLLEVGTGFHPELTGRENIFLNGAIMGMRKSEIQRKLDEIIDFSGVERYVDTPVKRYSSGMYVRLAFAVAAHLEPEILVIDEVLAVGDAEFQKKCLGKMKDVSVNEGRTVLFVSHTMAAVKNLCNKGILLKNGEIAYTGTAESAVDYYVSNILSSNTDTVCLVNDSQRKYHLRRNVEYSYLEFLDTVANSMYSTNEDIKLKIKFKGNTTIDSFRMSFSINRIDESLVGVFFSKEILSIKENGHLELEMTLKNHQLAKGQYYFDFSVGTGNEVSGITEFDNISKVLFFEIAYKDIEKTEMIVLWPSYWGSINFQNIELNIK